MGKPEGKRPFGKPKHWPVILKWRSKKLDEREWTGYMWPQMGTSS